MAGREYGNTLAVCTARIVADYAKTLAADGIEAACARDLVVDFGQQLAAKVLETMDAYQLLDQVFDLKGQRADDAADSEGQAA